jgi:hypothetical protein
MTRKIASKKRSGAPAGNKNALKTLPWPDNFDLSSREGVDQFLKEVIKATWEGRLGSRQAGAINNSIRVLIEHEALPELEKRIAELENNRGLKKN